MIQVSRLSAMPLFLRKQAFWNRLLDPLAQSGKNAAYHTLRLAAASHRWALDAKGFDLAEPTTRRLGLIDVAQSLLERGAWTLPSWTMETHLARKMEQDLDWSIPQQDPSDGNLAFRVASTQANSHFQHVLVTGRWPCEVTGNAADEIWARQEGEQAGSDAERQFFYEVLVPELGFPLLDYLRLQPALLTLGLAPQEFAQQRADFCIDTGRGLKLVIEVDGSQHRETSQHLLDRKRDQALREQGWTIWRIPTSDLKAPALLRQQLSALLQARKGRSDWGCEARIDSPRPKALLTCVWGATVAARIQFLLLQALRQGILPWDAPWRIALQEADTEIGALALQDLQDGFGRLRELFGESPCPAIVNVTGTAEADRAQLLIDISILQPHKAPPACDIPVAWSRPANYAGPIPQRKFAVRMPAAQTPSAALIETFVQDLLRKSTLREGQLDIVRRILMGRDVIGLLPTGGGKSLTYQLCGLLLGGLTIYVSPLKSLLQDQRERLLALGIDLAQEISSALSTAAKQQASHLLAIGGVRFLLIAPERLLIEGFRQQLTQFRASFGEVSQVVIDECHCVSEWGHDFRPAYLSLGRIVKARTQRLGVSAPLVALTGTASSIVLADVKRELGILGEEASVRARRLDRPEITLSCIKVRNADKSTAIKQQANDFMAGITHATDGMLVFTRFIGGQEGVLGIAASMKTTVPQDNLRFYTGSEPAWRQFAAFSTRRASAKITDQDIANSMPLWAVSPEGTPQEWEQVKAKTQSDFISGLPGNYQVLIATNAFGMGIDKPSIRRVVHYMTPQSPEAYYQEVGRAGRDKQASTAVLLFSDEEPALTDRILDPGASLDEARKLYTDFTERNRFGGGDFIRTFYFHQSAFSSPQQETQVLIHLFTALRAALAKNRALVFNYRPDNPQARVETADAWKSEKAMEYGIVRLILLGVLRDYTKEYNKQQFMLRLDPAWEDVHDQPDVLARYYAERFRSYVQRYQTHLKAEGEVQIRNAATLASIEAATAQAVVNFVYEQIERKRRQASRQMLELARVGTSDPALFRERLNHYLQASDRFTKALETLAQDPAIDPWHGLLISVDSVDELAELHGACQRVLESFPTHPGLLSISAATRLNPSPDDLKRSAEDYQAALQYAADVSGIMAAHALGNAIINYVSPRDETLAGALCDVLGLWLIAHGRKDEAFTRFMHRTAIRQYWARETLQHIKAALPDISEI